MNIPIFIVNPIENNWEFSSRFKRKKVRMQACRDKSFYNIAEYMTEKANAFN